MGSRRWLSTYARNLPVQSCGSNRFRCRKCGTCQPRKCKGHPSKNYIDYKEWGQLIGGHDGIVQTFQGGGVIIDEEGTRLPYCVEAVAAKDAKHLLRVSATLGNREQQRQVLAMLKTIEFY